MKLLIFLLLVATGYADKLDRSYLPPANAASSGGSPGALAAPGARPGFGASSVNSFGRGIPSAFGSQPGSTAGQIGASAYGGASGNFQSESEYGKTNGQGSKPNGIDSSAGSFIGDGGSFPALADGSRDQKFLPNSNTYDAGGQQSPEARPSGPIGPTTGRGGQGLDAAEGYKPERAQAAADRNAEILKYVNDNNGDTYTYSYETSNGISAEESGAAGGGVRAQGGFAYTGDDGRAYSVTYTADENGFRPRGEHLPTPHPIPEEILKSIEENARAAAAGTQEGSYRPEEYESDKEEYDAGIPSYGAPQGQGQGSKQGSISIQSPDVTQAQSNQFTGSQGNVGTSQSNGQAGQSGPSGSSQVTSGPTAAQGQNNRYQPSGNNNQGASGQLSGQSAAGQNQISEGQGQGPDGYKYNQPHNSFGQASQFGVPSGSGNDQGSFGFESGNRPSSGSPFATVQQFLNRPGSQLANSIQPTGQRQQNNLNGNRPSNYQRTSQQSQINLGNPGPGSGATSSSNQGYQYQANENRRQFGQDNGSDGKLGSTGQSQQNAKQPLLSGNIGPNQGYSQVSAGNLNIGSGDQLGQGNQAPFDSSRKPSASPGSERPSFGSSPSTQGSSASSFIQAPYQYDQPGQSFPAQSQRFDGQGPGSSASGSQTIAGQPSGSAGSQGGNGQQINGNLPGYQGSTGHRPSGSVPGPQGTNGQQSGGASSSYQRENEQSPGFRAPGAQGFNGQQSGSTAGYQGGNGKPSGVGTFGSQGVAGQQPGGNSPGYQGGQGLRPGVSSPSQSGAAQRPGYSSFGSPAGGAPPGGSGSDSGPGQFGGPRQPPSFSPQEGYRY